MTVFAQALDVLYTDPNMSVSGTYQVELDAPGQPVRVMRRSRAEEERLLNTGVRPTGELAAIRTSEVPTKPESGKAYLTLNGTRYRIRQATPDRERLEWRLDLDEQAAA